MKSLLLILSCLLTLTSYAETPPKLNIEGMGLLHNNMVLKVSDYSKKLPQLDPTMDYYQLVTMTIYENPQALGTFQYHHMVVVSDVSCNQKAVIMKHVALSNTDNDARQIRFVNDYSRDESYNRFVLRSLCLGEKNIVQ